MNENFSVNEMQLVKYEKEYSESRLWEKIKKVAKKAGIKVIYYVLVLFYAMKSENVTMAEKALIIDAPDYFILPLDIKRVRLQRKGIDERVKAQAKSKLKEWFGNYDESKLEE